MTGIVIDASVALAWCFPDEASDYADGVLVALDPDRLRGIGERLAVLALEVLHLASSLALLRPRDDDGWAALGVRRLGERAVDLLDVVTVDLDCMPAVRAGALRVRL